jgi:hypothetical protein
MNSFNLPSEAVEFLKAGKQLNYDFKSIEAGEVKLKRFDQLELKEVWIGTDIDGDPHANEDGYYSIPAVSLTGECKNYSPEFILLWLPEEKIFGGWDCDHWVLTVFPAATWTDIVASPAHYLNAQWDYSSKVGTHLKPWPKYQFKTGRPF